MHFRAVTTILLATLAASVSAMAIKPALALSGRPDNITLDVQVTAVNLFGFKNADGSLTIDSSLEARDDIEKRGATLVVLGITGTAAMAKVTEMAIEWGAELLGNINDWNRAREEFTKSVSDEMWARNPNVRAWPAVACYNKGYHLRNPAGVDGRATVKLEMGVLNTDYDCMYVSGNNQFYTHGDGGYINLAYVYDNTRCAFDRATGDLTCR